MIQVELGWAIATIVTIVGSLSGTITLLFRSLVKSYEERIHSDDEQIAYLRALVRDVTGTAREAASAGHEAVDLAARAQAAESRRRL